MENEQIVAI